MLAAWAFGDNKFASEAALPSVCDRTDDDVGVLSGSATFAAVDVVELLDFSSAVVVPASVGKVTVFDFLILVGVGKGGFSDRAGAGLVGALFVELDLRGGPSMSSMK